MGVERQAQKKIGELAEDNAKLRQELAEARVVIKQQREIIDRIMADAKANAKSETR